MCKRYLWTCKQTCWILIYKKRLPKCIFQYKNARGKKQKSVYERITETEQEIALTEQKLSELNQQLEEYKNEKDDLEMRQTWSTIKQNWLTMDDIQSLLEKSKVVPMTTKTTK